MSITLASPDGSGIAADQLTNDPVTPQPGSSGLLCIDSVPPALGIKAMLWGSRSLDTGSLVLDSGSSRPWSRGEQRGVPLLGVLALALVLGAQPLSSLSCLLPLLLCSPQPLLLLLPFEHHRGISSPVLGLVGLFWIAPRYDSVCARSHPVSALPGVGPGV